ncbi:MAG: TatD family hydrolase [Verrucomicrobiota bacterium]|nr:TatD family hydrolase [Verrucomicrobiota bacterium]
MLIDSHCHLDRFQKKGDLDAVLSRATASGVHRIITIGTSAEDWEGYSQMARAHPGQVYWTAGLHPCDVAEDFEDHLIQLPTFFGCEPTPVALGEIGLDNFHLPKDPEEIAEVQRRQRKAFKFQLDLALQLQCPVVIHSRHAFAECVAMIDASGVDWRKVVFHCFSEGPDEIRILNSRGGRGSFTGILTYKSAEPIRQAALAQGLDTLMLETDAPFLTPEPHRGKPNEPAFTRHTAERAALLFGLSLEALAARATANTVAFFGLE